MASLSQPLALAVRAGDPALYIAEKGGRVRAIRGGQVDGGAVLDLSGEVSSGFEQGLLGLAFAPAGTQLYVNYTDRAGDTHIVEYTFDGRRADPASARELLFQDQPFANHNGGNLVFGPDGLLYIGLGDGGSGGDPQGNAQRLDTLLGKMLRIDPRPSGGDPYTIPAGNPFAGQAGARAEIWAYGLRNPWRYSFDRQTGELWIADVGQNAIEEVNRAPRGSRGGENYGWNRREGTRAFRGSARPPGAVDPVYEYPTSGGNCSVTGGHVYRGSRHPALVGVYVFADYCAGDIMGLVPAGGGAVGAEDLGARVPMLSSFGQDADGELYALSLTGGVFRLE
ncbi:MAG: PQQ-dependent sugar dehydrogenase, partial [Acidimicrobiales bacterium]